MTIQPRVPKTRLTPLIETLHGKKIADPYRFLEHDDVAVKKWVEGQNTYTGEMLKSYGKAREKFSQELNKVMDSGAFSAPLFVHGNYLWVERKSKQNQPVLYYRSGLSGKQRVVIDVNKIRKDGTCSLDYWGASPKGTYIWYGLSYDGTEETIFHIQKVETTTFTPVTEIPYTRFAYIAWLSDESGLYYARYPKPGTVPKGEELYHQKVYFHALGTNPKNDPCVFGDGRRKEDMVQSLSYENGFLAIDIGANWAANETWILEHGSGNIHCVTQGVIAKFESALAHGRLYLMTNWKAPHFKILAAELKQGVHIKDFREIVKEHKDVMEFYKTTSDGILIGYLHNVQARLMFLSRDLKKKNILPLPSYASVTGIKARKSESAFFVSVSTFFESNAVFRFDAATGGLVPYRSLSLRLDPKKYTVTQEWYASHDGVKVPLFIMRKRTTQRNGNNPTILYGYGGFGVSNTPSFLRSWIPFLKRGGIYAMANIRGGGELGERWHTGGMLAKKQNSFHDFIAAGEYLIKKKYTDKDHLGIIGGSNGGLLVGACMIIRPDLFKAVVCRVPLLDMVRFPKFLMAKRWVAEYGDPEKAPDLALILKWSPYHNVKAGVEYPAVMFMTANKDTRVHPLHARKMAALLQSMNKHNPVLLRTEMNAGHGSGKPVSKMVDEQADVLTFLAWQFGMTIT